MSDQFLAEIRIFASNYPPLGWAQCNGQLMPISQNTALFSLLGTVYGGDGKSTFALPDLEGMVAIHPGQGPGLSLYDQGQTGGAQTITLDIDEMPVHTHQLFATSGNANGQASAGGQLGKGFKGNLQSSNTAKIYSPNAPQTPMAPQALTLAGGSQPHNNMMPYLVLNYCIALQGIYPPRP